MIGVWLAESAVRTLSGSDQTANAPARQPAPAAGPVSPAYAAAPIGAPKATE